MRERFPFSKISTLILFVLLFGSLLGSASASLTVKKIAPIAEIGAGYQSLAITSTHIALAGEGIEVRDRVSGARVVVQESSTSVLFTDLTTSASASGASFIAVGISESSVVTSREQSDGAINPDSITVASEEEKKVGLTRLILVEFTSSGEITRTSFFDSDKPLLPRSIHLFGEEIVIVGDIASDRGHQGFMVRRTLSGEDFQLSRFGEMNTSIFAAANLRTLYGSSEENLVGSKRQGASDGVILYLDKTGKAVKAVRSFASGAKREWSDVSPVHLAVGPLIRGKTSEVAITDFDSQGKPEWSTRIPGVMGLVEGRAVGVITKARIKALPGFRANSNHALFLQFDKKGSIKSAASIPAISIIDIFEDHALVKVKSGATQLISFS